MYLSAFQALKGQLQKAGKIWEIQQREFKY